MIACGLRPPRGCVRLALHRQCPTMMFTVTLLWRYRLVGGEGAGMKDHYAIGLMSGTSADGIDAALVQITPNGSELSIGLEHATFEPYAAEERSRIFAAFAPDFPAQELARLNWHMAEWFARAVQRLLDEAGMSPKDVLVIGSHGQTIAHYPPQPQGAQGYGMQIGEPAMIAALTGIDVVSNFRTADMAAGGQGAPLIPYFDYALLKSDIETRVVLNIGGIANITVLPAGASPKDVVGFDTGPGNMILDGLVELVTDGRQHYDEEGALARAGRCHDQLLHRWLAHPYFFRTPPKSTGRELFGLSYCRALYDDAKREGLTPPDLLRTATALTAESIARGIRTQITEPFALIVSGGGINNPVLMDELKSRSHLMRPWQSATEYGIPSDFKEAMAFALLAWQFCRGVPTNVPRATGAARSVVQGSWTPARAGIQIDDRIAKIKERGK